MPRVANVPMQLKYGESKSTPSSPKKNHINAKPFQSEEVTSSFQRMNLDNPHVQVNIFITASTHLPINDE